MQAARKNPRRWLERVFYITTKGNPGQPPVMPLVFNDPQADINDAILDQRKKNRPPRIIVLKSRQPGISTLSCGFVTATAWAVPHSTSMILTHLDESSVKMLGKCAFGLDNLPPEIKPVEKRRKTDLIKLDHIQCSDGQVQLNSEIQVSTASGHELWRGMTIRVAHLSEFSRFPYPGKTLGGLLQSVPKTPESLVVIESTANGEGDAFHEEWLRAESGESDFVPIFIPWWKLPDARLPVPVGFRATKNELDLKKHYKLSEEQLVWYRYVSVTECSGDPDMFNQEFPATPALAFITTGKPAFPTKPLSEMYERARKKEPMRGEVLETESGPRFSRDGDGCLAIYIPPKAEHDYTIGGDPAAGVEGGDFSCAAVYDRQTSEIVAVWHGTITPIEFGQRMMQLGLFYNTAWLAPECNGGHGFSVISEMKQCFYPKIYVYTRQDKIRNTITNFLGWETTFRTRGLLFDSMHWALTNHEIMIWDVPSIAELRSMRRMDDRRAEGLKHDDRTFAIMIAYRCHLEMPMQDTGMPPRLRIPPDPKVESILRDLPEEPLAREIWMDTDRILRSISTSHRRALDEYAQMPDIAEEQAWDPTAKSWMPDVPW
jgi:hypothetical protein